MIIKLYSLYKNMINLFQDIIIFDPHLHTRQKLLHFLISTQSSSPIINCVI